MKVYWINFYQAAQQLFHRHFKPMAEPQLKKKDTRKGQSLFVAML